LAQSPHVDGQHALMEYDDEQRCFILKDLNSSTGTYVHDCRVQNAAVRLADGDFIRFGFNGLPLEFRIEQQQQQQEVFDNNFRLNNNLILYSQQCHRYINDNRHQIIFNL
jgi:pSer/pThr/pTyr-binding forkhead associated (FHA) protein